MSLGFSQGSLLSAGVAEDSATTAWVAAVVLAGGAVSATQRTRVDALIVGLKADALFTVMDGLWIFAGESDEKQATIDLITNSVATKHGTVALNASGYLTDGVGGSYLSTTINPNTALNFAQDSANIGAYITTLRGISVDGHILIGVNSGGSDSFIAPLESGATTVYELNGGTYPSFACSQAGGCWTVSRTVSTAISLYKNGSVLASPAGNSTAVANQTFDLLANNGNGTPSTGSVDRVGAIWCGSGLNATQAGNLSTRINTYMTAWGINVY